MGKKILYLICSFLLMFNLTSCGISSLFDIDFDNYGKVAKTEDGWLIYQENKYYPTQEYLFDMSRNTEEDIERRLSAAKRELQFLPYYDFIVVNEAGKADEAAEKIKDIVRVDTMSTKHNPDFVSEFYKHN